MCLKSKWKNNKKQGDTNENICLAHLCPAEVLGFYVGAGLLEFPSHTKKQESTDRFLCWQVNPGISLETKSIKERAVLRLIPSSQEIHAFVVFYVITFGPLKGQMTKASHQILLRSPCAGPVKGVRDTQDPSFMELTS